MLDQRQEVTDALSLLDYAVANGVKTADGNPLPHDIVAAIKSAAEKLGLLGSNASTATLLAADWSTFELAYYDLASALSPVTAETLRNTASILYQHRTWCDFICGDSASIRFTRILWVVTIVFVLIVLGSNWYLGVMSERGNTNSYAVWRIILELLTPWVYGGLGACVYLLRSAHVFIYQRCFDVRRRPEYWWNVRRDDGSPDADYIETLHARFSAIHARSLAVRFTDDPFATNRATVRILELFPNVSSVNMVLSASDVDGQKIGHFGFFRSRFRTTLWPKVLYRLIALD